MRVCVVGAGVVGLNTALEVQRQLGPSTQLTVLADLFNQDTTGDGAAGLFLPSSYFTGPTLDITRQWVRDSYDWYNKHCFSDHATAAGIAPLSGYLFSDVAQERVENEWMKEVAPEYRAATPEELELHPGGARFGTYLTSLLVECRYFLPWALERIQQEGAVVKRGSVRFLTDLANDYDVVFNCTGLGARALCKDYTLVPVRGQVFKVKAPWIKHFFYDDHDTYVIPNRELVTLGGTRWLGNWDLNINRYESESIWDRCVAMVPSLKRARVHQQWVGLRPHRSPVRVEAEVMAVSGRSPMMVVHNYGHGGYGITSAPGTAKYAVSLLKDCQRGSAGSCKL